MNKETKAYLDALDSDGMTEEEIKLSHRATELLAGDKVVGVSVLCNTRKEFFIRFASGRMLFIDNFNSSHDISIT
jgi:hypothetical protein